MKNRRLRDEVSAYIDGEAADPERIERLIREDAEAARYYDGLLRLSQGLRALEHPGHDPHFAARVIGRVREGGERGNASRRAWWSLAGAAAAACLLVAAAWFVMPGRPEPASPAAAQDEQVLLELVEQRLAREPEAQEALEAYVPEEPVVLASDVSGESWLEVLASQSWFDVFAENVEGGQDLDMLLDSLTEEETSALREALIDYARAGYAQGGWPT